VDKCCRQRALVGQTWYTRTGKRGEGLRVRPPAGGRERWVNPYLMTATTTPGHVLFAWHDRSPDFPPRDIPATNRVDGKKFDLDRCVEAT
jgi:hypothetical protein